MTPTMESLVASFVALLAVAVVLAWCDWKVRQIDRQVRADVMRLLRDLAKDDAERESWQKKLDAMERLR